jgi:hypothetical protein
LATQTQYDELRDLWERRNKLNINEQRDLEKIIGQIAKGPFPNSDVKNYLEDTIIRKTLWIPDTRKTLTSLEHGLLWLYVNVTIGYNPNKVSPKNTGINTSSTCYKYYEKNKGLSKNLAYNFTDYIGEFCFTRIFNEPEEERQPLTAYPFNHAGLIITSFKHYLSDVFGLKKDPAEQCPHCNEENPLSSEFCHSCHQHLVSRFICTNDQCKKIIPRTSKKCEGCGKEYRNKGPVKARVHSVSLDSESECDEKYTEEERLTKAANDYMSPTLSQDLRNPEDIIEEQDTDQKNQKSNDFTAKAQTFIAELLATGQQHPNKATKNFEWVPQYIYYCLIKKMTDQSFFKEKRGVLSSVYATYIRKFGPIRPSGNKKRLSKEEKEHRLQKWYCLMEKSRFGQWCSEQGWITDKFQDYQLDKIQLAKEALINESKAFTLKHSADQFLHSHGSTVYPAYCFETQGNPPNRVDLVQMEQYCVRWLHKDLIIGQWLISLLILLEKENHEEIHQTLKILSEQSFLLVTQQGKIR